MPLKCIHTVNQRELRLCQSAISANDKPRTHIIPSISFDVPQFLLLIPDGFRHGGAKHRQVIQVVLARNRLTVAENFRSTGVMIDRDVVHFIQQR